MAATVAPPMLDITRHCGASHGRSATAMSECVVAESEARSDLLQQWARFSDVSVEKCVKLNVKAKRQPYVALSRCLSNELAANAANPPTATSEVKVVEPGKAPDTGARVFKSLKSIFSSN